MVQLKSFRYTGEPEIGVENGASSGSDLSSIVVTGGNLSSDKIHSKAPQQRAEWTSSQVSPEKNSHKQLSQEAEDGSGSASSAECQESAHQLSGDEEKPEEEATTSGQNGAENGTGEFRFNVAPVDVSSGTRKGLAMSPHAPGKDGRPRSRLRNISDHSQQANDSGSGTGPGRLQQSRSGDNVSDQGSIGIRQAAAYANHFEIRWRNLNLAARNSKLPRFIAENPIYRHLKANWRQPRQTESSQQDKIFYSPPVRHKTGLGAAERLEMSSHNIGSGDKLAADKWSVAEQGSAHDTEYMEQQFKADYRPILRNLSGSVFSGQLTAILGPSGVGKTSLLNSLTGRNTLHGAGRVTLLGGASERMSVVTVPQADILPAKLTTLEDLSFTSRLKNSRRGFNHHRNIARLVRHLQMESFLHTRIDKLSGGEARRLSIARELLNSPDIMILDEPTSGLDANTCKKIIGALHDIVEQSEQILDRPMSIIVTIHQPQQEVLNLFHRIYVLAQGGRAIYEGPPDELMSQLLAHSSLLKVCPAPEQLNENPAIVAIEVASGEYGPHLIEELAMHHESNCYDQYFADDGTPLLANGSPFLTPKTLRAPKKSPVSVAPSRPGPLDRMLAKEELGGELGKRTPMLHRRHFMGSQVDRVSSITNLSYCSTYDADLPQQTSRLKVDKRLRRSVVMKGDFISHTMTLMSRCWLLTTRDTFLMAIRILGFCMVAGGMVQIFASSLDKEEHVCPLYESQVDDLLGYIRSAKTRLLNMQSLIKQSNNTHLFFFQLCLCICMVTSALTGLVFPLQMRMFIREYKNGWYSPAAFITSQTLAELPVDMIGPTITVLLSYPLCNQPDSPYYWREIGYIVVLIMAAMVCKSQAQIVGAFLMNSVENSVFLSCVMVCPSALLSGISVRISSLSVPLQYCSYGSFLRYAFESLFVLRYGYGICPCDQQLVRGFPLEASSDALPPQLERMSRGILDLNSNQLQNPNANSTNLASFGRPESEPNFIVGFLRLISSASNMFSSNMEQLGNCSSYTSLGLMSMNIPDYILPQWISVLFLMLIFSRILTYYTVKSVIKFQTI